MFTVYILRSAALDKFYVGFTGDDVGNRLKKHLTDHAGFTAKAKDWVIVYTESFASKTEAAAREKAIKAWKSKKLMLQLITRHGSAGSEHPDF